MSGISSSIGLISGIDTAAVIDQLIALERRPIDNLEKRVSAIEVQRTAFLQLSAQILALQGALEALYPIDAGELEDESLKIITPGMARN